MMEPKYPQAKAQLTGEDGNALAVIMRTTQALKRAGVPKDEVKAFQDEAMSGDYGHLLATCMRWADCS